MTRIDRTRVALRSFGFLAVCAMLLFFAASPSAAQPDPAPDTIEIDLSVRALDYDEQTGLFIVTADSDDFSQCGSLRIHILDRSGNERWQVPTPVPCQTTIHDGILYASSENLIRSFDLATGTMIRSWTAPDQAKTRQLFFGGGLLWFNHGSTYSQELRHSLPSGVGTLDPQSDAPPTLRVIEDAQMVAASSDGGTQWVVTDQGLTKVDQNNLAATQPTVSIPGVYRGMWAPFVLTNDEDHLYFAQGPTLIDAASLAVLDTAEPSRSFNSLDEGPNGTLVADAGGSYTGAVAFAEHTTRQIGLLRFSSGPSVQAATLVGDEVAVVHTYHTEDSTIRWIQFYDLAPGLAGPIETTMGFDTIDANQPRTITMRVHFADAVEKVTVNGQSLSFTALPEFSDKEWLSVQLPALPEGTHRFIFDGPLGRSAPATANPTDPAHVHFIFKVFESA